MSDVPNSFEPEGLYALCWNHARDGTFAIDAGSLLDAEAVRICADLFRTKRFMVPGWIRD